jgi:hypothetical protein
MDLEVTLLDEAGDPLGAGLEAELLVDGEVAARGAIAAGGRVLFRGVPAAGTRAIRLVHDAAGLVARNDS